jgi:hypothetical protein
MITIALLALPPAVVVTAVGIVATGGSRRPGADRTRATTLPTATPVAPVAEGAGGSPRAWLSIDQVEHGFAASYTAYLDGRLPVSALRYASITARDQARAGGRIPGAFRDGQLTVRSITGQGSTLFSAQTTITLADRAESYPFTVMLLRDRWGWRIAQLTAPDLSVDDNTHPSAGWPAVPRTGQLAAARFAVGYVEYRARERSLPAGVTSTAAAQAQTGSDPLAQTTIAHGAVRMLALRYGPLERDRFAATATVAAGGRRVSFTFLMVRTPAGWRCDAFL